MYLSSIRLWNFRKFGSGNSELDLNKPDLVVPFSKGLSVLIGENDSGKTTIVDAIKLVLDTHSSEWVKVEKEDFNQDATRLRIECRFDDLSDDEAKNFTEWLGIEERDGDIYPYLRVILDVSRQNDRILPFDIRAGLDEDGYRLKAEAREYLKTTYLKPLRDAKSELTPRKGSRLSQILIGNEAFKDGDETHWLMKEGYEKFKDAIIDYFKEEKGGDSRGKNLSAKLENYLEHFFGEKKKANFYPTKKNLREILEILKLALEEDNLGLGSQNVLFIAAELLNLERSSWNGLRLGLIEELEAHLHPQSQLKVISFLQEMTEKAGNQVQLIITTHSPNLGSKVKLDNLILCTKEGVFPMGYDRSGKPFTKLAKEDFRFLERFLDVTKANLFFAKGVILVEGWAEELILPSLAQKMDLDLTQSGVSVINLASTAFLRYSKIFQREGEERINIPVSVITDLDVKPDKENEKELKSAKTKGQLTKAEKEKDLGGQSVKVFVSPHWTLEYCLSTSNSLEKIFFDSVLEVHTGMDRTKVLDEVIKKLSKHNLRKAEIAQIFADKVAGSEISKTDLEADENIKYLIDAIKYATRV